MNLAEMIENETNKYAKQFYELLLSEGYNLADGNKYEKAKTKVTLICDKGHKYITTPSSFKSGYRCGTCNGGISFDNGYFEKYVLEVSNGEYTILEKYSNNHTPITIRHNNLSCDNYEWKVIPSDFRNKGSRCPICSILRGDSHPSYDPKIPQAEREKGRWLYTPRLEKWRNDVFRRDGFVCQVCFDKKKTFLNAHHLNGYHWDKENRFNVDNGVTLCKGCHVDFHKNYGKKNNSKEQFEDYKIKFLQHT